jgi:hypothetical protein
MVIDAEPEGDTDDHGADQQPRRTHSGERI